MDNNQKADTLTLEPLSLDSLDFSHLNYTQQMWDANVGAEISSVSLTPDSYGGALASGTAGMSLTSGTASAVYTIGNGGTYSTGGTYNWANTWNSTNSPGNVQIRGNVVVEGDNSDIFVRGQSLLDMLTGIQERLAWTVPNPELEAEWDELRELGERYRALEKQCREKADMWNKLKSMPPPKVDL